MRRTEAARQQLGLATSQLGQLSPNDPMVLHHYYVARALSELTYAIADIYDRLLVIERKQGGGGFTTGTLR